MFKAVLNDISWFKSSFESIASIVDEISLEIDSEGIRTKALDRSHITFINFELKPDAFDEYQCSEPVKAHVDTEELLKVLKRGKSDDIMTLSREDTNFVIVFKGEATRTFKIRTISMEYEAPDAPELEWPVQFDLPYSVLKNTVQDMELYSDKLTFEVKGNQVKVYSEGEYGDASVIYPIVNSSGKNVKSTFSLEKVKEMLKTDKFSDTVWLELGNDMPLNLWLEREDEGKLGFLLAPRIEQEED